MFADRHFTAIGIFKTFVIIVLLLATMIFGAGYVYVNQAGGLRRLLHHRPVATRCSHPRDDSVAVQLPRADRSLVDTP